MNANQSTEPITSKYVIWGAAVIAFLLVFGSVWLASSLVGKVPTSASESKPGIPAEPRLISGPHQVYIKDPAVNRETPDQIAKHLPDLSSDSSGRVTVVVKPAGSQPANTAAGPSNGSKSSAGRKTSPVKDMFPVGNIVKDRSRPATPSYKQVDYNLPIFEYDGRKWEPTGAFAMSSQVDLKPVGATQDGKDIYVLSNASTSDQVLFMKSTTDPDRYAIYRATQG